MAGDSQDKFKYGGFAIFKKWWFWLIIAFLLVGGAGYFSSPEESFPESDSQAQDEDVYTGTPSAKETKQGGLTENDVELYCQDAGLLGKYIDTNAIDIYRILDQNDQTGKFGWVDVDGNDVWYVRWNGKDKSTDESVRFDCWVSGSSADDIRLHKLEVGGVSYVDTVSSTVFTEVGGDPVVTDNGL